jgi:hypothetical protein
MPFTPEQIQTARTFAARRGFPQLKGTPAQIDWAEQIRRRIMKNLDRQIRSGQGVQRTSNFQRTKEFMLTRTEAGWWIEQRHSAVTAVTKQRSSQVLEAYASLLRPAKIAS